MIEKISIDLGDFTPGLFSTSNASSGKKGSNKKTPGAGVKSAEKAALLEELRTQYKTADAVAVEKTATIASKSAIGHYNLETLLDAATLKAFKSLFAQLSCRFPDKPREGRSPWTFACVGVAQAAAVKASQELIMRGVATAKQAATVAEMVAVIGKLEALATAVTQFEDGLVEVNTGFDNRKIKLAAEDAAAYSALELRIQALNSLQLELSKAALQSAPQDAAASAAVLARLLAEAAAKGIVATIANDGATVVGPVPTFQKTDDVIQYCNKYCPKKAVKTLGIELGAIIDGDVYEFMAARLGGLTPNPDSGKISGTVLEKFRETCLTDAATPPSRNEIQIPATATKAALTAAAEAGMTDEDIQAILEAHPGVKFGLKNKIEKAKFFEAFGLEEQKA